MNAALVVLEDTIAKAVTCDSGMLCSALTGKWGRGPEPPALLVAQVQRLPAGVSDGVVLPWGQSKLVRVFGPSVGGPLSDTTVPNCGLASTFTQGAGVTRPGWVVMTYSRPSGVKPPIPLKQIRSARGPTAPAKDARRAYAGTEWRTVVGQ